ncbi:MAG: hypothetical protein OEW11_08015 [Nitrospirota bacterium]|nr:hypothetical protein [Nitrospirota bacterium]
MCQIAIDRVDADTLQQATRLTVTVSGQCGHGGDVYLRVLWNNGQLGAESAPVQVPPTYRHVPVTSTAHNHPDRIQGIRAVIRCKKGSSYVEREL